MLGLAEGVGVKIAPVGGLLVGPTVGEDLGLAAGDPFSARYPAKPRLPSPRTTIRPDNGIVMFPPMAPPEVGVPNLSRNIP